MQNSPPTRLPVFTHARESPAFGTTLRGARNVREERRRGGQSTAVLVLAVRIEIFPRKRGYAGARGINENLEQVATCPIKTPPTWFPFLTLRLSPSCYFLPELKH